MTFSLQALGATTTAISDHANTAVLAADWDRLGPTFGTAIVDTLIMVSVTLVVGGLLGLCLGVLLYTSRAGGILQNKALYTFLNLLVNFVRPIPFIIMITAFGPLTLAVVGTTIGREAAMFIMSIAATFGVARIVEQNLVSIDPGVIEAARSMGANPWQIITTVIIPEALGPLVLGYTFIFIAIVDMSAMAGYIGGGGLGDFAIVYGYRAYDWQVTYVATFAIIIIVQVAQLFGNWLSKKIMRR
ncbi:methionine ABC transporter permease [Corynebacterium gerontici]|uniref:Methionine import system permease protein MetP n=1 Tax=Corynebacterium gerontici TaxID=2079234 RepID=A0A3G6J3W6_9CORY|nr:methionine ABC transporter permease [Corynebacterium gerontici]AZA10784.1 Methionine import system permease protein MetP [Corynebacterium gerontici]